MPLICQCCGKKIQAYCVVKYDVEYLETYLSDYFERPVKQILGLYKPKPAMTAQRAICIKILMRYGMLTYKQIMKRYDLGGFKAYDYNRQLDPKNVDYRYIDKDLSNNMPEVIKVKYQPE